MLCLTRIVVLIAGVVLLAGNAFAANVRLGHAMPDSHPQAAAMIKFAELVRDYTNSGLNVQLYHGAQLGSDEKMLQAVQAGTQEFYIGTLASFATRIKEVQIWDIPFAYAADEELLKLFQGPSAKQILKNMEAIGVKGLAWSGIGFRCVSNNKRPIEKLEDISGLKLRVMTNPIAMETWKTLGANAVPMAFAEVFTALETRTIDGQENPLMHMYSNKMQEVQKYISLTNHVYTAVGLIASKKWWDGLTPELQAAVQKAADEAAILEGKLIIEGDKGVIKNFEEAGVQVNSLAPEELARIREKVQPVADKFVEIVGADFYKEFQNELKAIRAAAQ
jgi:tripartite ATP-independent transporter DctP family solute receptor